jgi:hypothetical protein
MLTAAAGNRPRAAALGQSIPLVYTQENSGIAYPAPSYPDFAFLPIVRQLPDPFVFSDGTRDTSFAALDRHRNEWAGAIAKYEQGPKPLCTGDPVKDSVLGVGYTCSVSATWSAGTGQNRTITVQVTVTPTATGIPNTKSFTVAVVLPTPSATCVQPAAGWPIVMGMGSATGSWPASAFNASTNSPAGVTVKPTGCAATVNFPLNSIAAYGSGGTFVHSTDLFYQLYPNLCSGSTSPSTTAGTCNAANGFPGGSNSGEYTAWAWGLSRVLDAIQKVAAQSPALPLDTTRSATSGCSYAGKMALWTAALDERVALAIAQENGGGGAPAWRISREIETQGSVENISNTSYSWFNTSTLSFAGHNVYKLPYDHHQLLALMAPRAVLQTGNSNFYWLGDRSNTFSSKAAAKVWEELGIGDRFNYYIDTNHGHCAVPAYQQNAAQPVINKFLFGTDTPENNATLPLRVHSQFENTLAPGAQPKWDATRWTAWWGTGNPAFPNGGVWNHGGSLVLPVNQGQGLTLNTGDVVSSAFRLTMPGAHAPGTVTVPTSYTEVDVACTDGTSYTFAVPPPLPATTAAGYPPVNGTNSAANNPQSFTIGVNDNGVYASTPNTAQNPGCSNGAPGKVTAAYFFALGKPNPGAGNPGLAGFVTTSGVQASGATDPLNVAVNLSNSTTGEGGAFTPWTTINRLNPHSCAVPGCPLTPTLTWPAPAPLVNGMPLSATQLNAVATSRLLSGLTVTGVGTSGLPVEVSVPGTFTYDPPLGTVLGPGAHTLNVTFTPTNVITPSTTAANAYKTYTISTASVPIMVGTVTVTAASALSRIAGGYQMVVTVKNTGNVPASNVQLTSAALGSASAATVPASLGDIASGASASVTLTFPSSAGANGATVIQKLSGTYSGGTFGANARTILP